MQSASNPIIGRDWHLFGPGPKRILALSGGGVRGALSVAFLERIEQLLDEKYGTEIRLGDHFDLIGGTSTGALIAGALAMGYRTQQIKAFYVEHAASVFRPRSWNLPILQSKFDDDGLRAQIEGVLGDRRLSSLDLITGFALVTKRMDTGSVWTLANNPHAPYWESGEGFIGNKHFPLSNLVRASTAAPHFFDPELLPILPTPDPADSSEPLLAPLPTEPNREGLFIDGGVSPYNNPSLALLQLVSLRGHGINWPLGPEQLTITSIGTGSFRPRLSFDSLGMGRNAKLAFHALLSMMADSEKQALTLLQWLGETAPPWVIDSEIGDLAGDRPPGGKLFRFQRYDIRLEQEWLETELGLTPSAADIAAWRRIDDPGSVKALFEMGVAAAKLQVRAEDWV